MRCYVDGFPCDCGAYDVANECPRDPYCHEEDPDILYDTELVPEEMIDDGYEAKSRHQDKDDCYDRF